MISYPSSYINFLEQSSPVKLAYYHTRASEKVRGRGGRILHANGTQLGINMKRKGREKSHDSDFLLGREAVARPW